MRRIIRPTVCVLALCGLFLWVPIASGQQTSATGTPQPVAGSTVVVKMIDTVDSSSDPAGKQYRAGLTRPVNVGNGVIVARGSVATLTLARSASGWGVQLSSRVINGQVVPVTSNAGSVIGTAAQSDVANAANSALGGLFGKKPNPIPVVAAVATGERVILPPGTSLSFVLNASPAANGPASANPAQANTTALPANQPGRSYYCTFNDTVQRPNMTHYFSGVFEADASQIEVSKAWTNYIRQTYLPGDNRDSGGCQIGTADQQQQVETTLRRTWQAMATGSERAGMKIPTNTVVDVSWKYVPDHPSASSAAGTPPSTAAASVAPPAYTASAAIAAKPPAAAQPIAQAQKQRETFCSATYSEGNSPITHYRSGVFQFTGGNPAVPGALPEAIGVAWRSYLVKTYHIPVNNYIAYECYNLLSDPAGQRTIAWREQSWKFDRGEIVRADWKYTPDQLAPSAAAAPTAQRTSGAAPGQGGPAQAQKQQGGEWWWYCTAGPYMTGVFSYPADATTSADVDSAIQFAWSNHVKKTYANLALGGGCTLGGADQALTQRSHDHMKASQGAGGVFDVDWKYVPGQDTPPVRIGYYYCFAYFDQNSQNNYASSVLAAPMGLDTDIMGKDFAQFVKEKYQSGERGEKVTGTCYGAAIDKAVAEAGKPNMEARWRSGKWIETGWKPTTLPPARDMGRH